MNEKKTIVIVGLGNPGKKYANTPHNTGFLVIDEIKRLLIADGVHITEKNKKELSTLEAMLADTHVLLAKPLLFMNRSGEVIKQLTTNYQLPATSYFCLVHDDIDLPLGIIRIKSGGGAAGHKGVASILERLGRNNFLRVRIGVLAPMMPQKRSPEFMNEYVTKKLRGENKKVLIRTVSYAAQLIEKALLCGKELKELTGDYSILKEQA